MRQKNDPASWDKTKSPNLSGQNKITQPLGTKKITQPFGTRVGQTMALIGRPTTTRIPAHMDDPQSKPNLQRPG